MNTYVDKTQKSKCQSVSSRRYNKQSDSESAFHFVDNRPESVAQRKLQEVESNSASVTQLKAFQEMSDAQQESVKRVQLQKIKANDLSGSQDSVLQLGKWTRNKVKAYKAWLRRRARRRWAKGKRKSSLMLLRKYIRARKLSEPGWSPGLADAPKSGHHVPPLALSNKHKGSFVFGKRGLKKEKLRDRIYFSGGKSDRREAHWLAHEAEAMQGLNRQSTFSGTDKELGDRMVAAHHGLTLTDGTPIMVEKRSQLDPPTGVTEQIGGATRSLVESQTGNKHAKIEDDSTDSEPDFDFDDYGSDSDSY